MAGVTRMRERNPSSACDLGGRRLDPEQGKARSILKNEVKIGDVSYGGAEVILGTDT